MIAYIDTPVFVDYFVGRHSVGTVLRATPRRGRSPEQLGTDADSCFRKLSAAHSVVTSALTFYEIEEAMFAALRQAAAERSRAASLIVPAARAVVPQMLAAVALFGITVVDLTEATVQAHHQNDQLRHRGIRSADALHISTALLINADLFLTGDKELIDLDGLFEPMRFFDTDVALRHLS